MAYELENGAIRVLIDPVGAEPVSLVFRGRERLWQNENGGWAGHAPVLFPVCGNCAVIEGGVRYPIPRHGFARGMRFSLRSRTENSLSFTLCADAETFRLYPFDFLFTVTYLLEGDSLLVRYEAENPADKRLFFSWGGHFSHKLFAPLGEHFLRFPAEEEFNAYLHGADGRLTGERRALGKGNTFFLPEEELSEGNTLIFAPKSRAVVLGNARGKVAALEFEGFGYLLLWRPDGADMICIEPWANLPDRAGDETPFSRKRLLSAGKGERLSATQKITSFEV